MNTAELLRNQQSSVGLSCRPHGVQQVADYSWNHHNIELPQEKPRLRDWLLSILAVASSIYLSYIVTSSVLQCYL